MQWGLNVLSLLCMQLRSGQYFGEKENETATDEITVLLSAFTGTETLPVHHHENPYFCLVLNGTYEERMGCATIVCTEGDVLFHPGGAEHSNKFNRVETRCLNIEFKAKHFEYAFETMGGLNSIIKSNQPELRKILLRIGHEMKHWQNDSKVLVEAYILESLVLLARGKQKAVRVAPYLKRIEQYLKANIERSPGLDEIATIGGVSKEHLARSFRVSYGCTIGEYMRRLKIESACHILQSTSLPINDVALACGFVSTSHFIRTFSNLIGTTPTNYRNIISKR